uniref:Uncharacterized protein n=1 Tax=Romanomermis culicivorax TaxID=13658 RepID=A0A915IW05_ROMCU
MIDGLWGRRPIVGSTVPKASQLVVAAVAAGLTAAVEKKQIYWALALNFAVGNQWKVYGHGSNPVSDPCWDGS